MVKCFQNKYTKNRVVFRIKRTQDQDIFYGKRPGNQQREYQSFFMRELRREYGFRRENRQTYVPVLRLFAGSSDAGHG